MMVASCISVWVLEKWWRDEEWLLEPLFLPFLLLRPGWLLVKADLLHSWLPSGHPGRFISCGGDRAMARRGHHGDDCQYLLRQWLPVGSSCKCLCFFTVCHRNTVCYLYLDQTVVPSSCVSLHILLFNFISVLKIYLSCRVCLIWPLV